jgi:YidC/Oxa1 family membrane protein insertase
MDKRLVLAMGLSLLVIISWSALMPKQQHIENQGVATKPSQLSPSATPVVASAPPPQIANTSIPLKEFTIAREKYTLHFIEPWAAVKEIVFTSFRSQNAKLNLQNGLYIQTPGLEFRPGQCTSADRALFVHSDAEKRITKEVRFSNSNYNIELDITYNNLSSSTAEFKLPLALGVLNFSGDQNEARFQDITVETNDRTIHPNPQKDFVCDNVQFLALRNRYFCAIVQPNENKENNYSAWIKKLSPQTTELGLQCPVVKILPGEENKQKFSIYLGPQDLRFINQVNPRWSTVMYYGTFSVISQFLLQLLDAIYRLVHNWGLAIVVLSIIIYILLYPLTLKQMRSMKEMQALQPAIAELRRTYKDNPQRLNKEVMELYRKHKVNPLGGCLPMILQIPIFFALYQALIRSISLKGAGFLWIKDLADPDRLFTTTIFGKSLDINILPILMAAEMFIQQKISGQATGTASNEQQKMMLIVFPVMFGLIFYSMPAGLVLYWFINSTLMLAYQLKVTVKR